MNVLGEYLVNSKLNVLEAKPARVTPGSAVRTVTGPATQPGNEKPVSEDEVQLTGAARSLAAAEQSLRAVPVIDELRVAAVKQRLSEGTYEIDPQRIADRLLRLENDLAGASPLESGKLK